MYFQQDQLIAEGNLDLVWDSYRVSLDAAGLDVVGLDATEGLELSVGLPLPGLTLSTHLSELSIAGLSQSLQEGMLWQGQQQTTGSVLVGLQQGLFLQLEDLKYQNYLRSLEFNWRCSAGWYSARRRLARTDCRYLARNRTG